MKASQPDPGAGGDPLVMSVVEAARMLGISKTLAYKLVARGELPSVRLCGRTRISRRGVERLLEARHVGLRDEAKQADPATSRQQRRRPRRAPAVSTGHGALNQPRAQEPALHDRNPDITVQLTLFEPTPQYNPTRPTDQLPTRQSQPTPEPPPYRELPPSNRPDTSAPGVPQRGAGSR